MQLSRLLMIVEHFRFFPFLNDCPVSTIFGTSQQKSQSWNGLALFPNSIIYQGSMTLHLCARSLRPTQQEALSIGYVFQICYGFNKRLRWSEMCCHAVAIPIFCIEHQGVWSLDKNSPILLKFRSVHAEFTSKLNVARCMQDFFQFRDEWVKARTDDFARFCRDNSKLDWQVLLETVKNTSLRGWFWKKNARYMIASRHGSAGLASGI